MSTPQPASIVMPKNTTAEDGRPTGTMLEKTLHIHIRDSLGNLALHGPSGGTWTLVDGTQHQVLGHSLEKDAGAAVSQLSNAIIHKVTLCSDMNEFPVALGVHVNCIPPQEFTELGDAYAYTVLPKATTTTPQVLFEAHHLSEDMMEFHKQYPNFTTHNLETEGVMPINNQSVVFLDHKHPAVGVLRNNQQLIGVDIDSMKKIDNTWYKITRPVLAACCDAIRMKILNKIQTHDLNTLSVQIHRLHATGWEDLGDGSVAMKDFKAESGLTQEALEDAKRQHLQNFTKTPYSYMARLKIQYELPTAN
jgi:hypothetical protein